MKRILYLLPFVLLMSCRPTKFVCNQQLITSKEPVEMSSHKLNAEFDSIISTNYFHKISIPKYTHNLRTQTVKNNIVFNKIPSTIFVKPQDSSFKNPGLQKAKDAMDDEGNWITAYFVFLGLLVLFLLTLSGAISFGIFLSEEILIMLVGISAVAMLVSYIGSLARYYKNKAIVNGYPSEMKRHNLHKTVLLIILLMFCI